MSLTAATVLALDGKTRCRIVVAKDADAGTKAVAADFAAILKQITGSEPLGANLPTNSSFEADIDADRIPDGWRADGDYLPGGYSVDPDGVTIDDSMAHSGKRSVRLTKIPAAKSIVALRQRFNVGQGEVYRANVRYRADLAAGSPHIIFTAFGRDGKWLRHLSGARGVKHTGDKWLELSVPAKVEQDVVQLMIEFLFYPDAAAGVVWIDDFECARIRK